ncbi:hypothetical protein FrCorBMG51_03715 [Protofrankia coriariae]|uniref:Transposase n=1 Tax=Protofrankia coriariae TaxID=1562887 RepID=A0ABR5F7R9_9ACTN|nr:hypothetical protein FrCorBMG51_03715 [Protofrankia coriariae]
MAMDHEHVASNFYRTNKARKLLLIVSKFSEIFCELVALTLVEVRCRQWLKGGVTLVRASILRERLKAEVSAVAIGNYMKILGSVVEA